MTRRQASLRVVCFMGLTTLVEWPLHAVPPIVQLPGTAGCVTEDGTAGACANGVALDLATGVAVSPDGRNVYAAAQDSDAVLVFDRHPLTGAITQKPGLDGCVSDTGTGGQCAHGVALDGARGVVVSPDGRSVYAIAGSSNSVLIYDRDLATGELLFKPDVAGCISNDGSGDQCVDGNALVSPFEVVVSPDGRNVYVATTTSSAVAVFVRDTDGTLQQAGCISAGGIFGCTSAVAFNNPTALAVSPDGKNVYVTNQNSDSVAILNRNLDTGALTQKAGTDGCWSEDGTMGACQDGVALDTPFGVAVTADGRSVYVASRFSEAVAVFDRNLTNGTLTQKAGLAGCVSSAGPGGGCTQSVVDGQVFAVAASPDGESVFVASLGDLVVYDRDPSSGALSPKAGLAACIGSDPACTDGRALSGSNAVAVSDDGKNVYTAASQSDGLAVFTRDVPSYDIDGDGQLEPLTDGLLLLRYLFGFRGATLVNGAVDLANCTRCTAAEIEAYIEALQGP